MSETNLRNYEFEVYLLNNVKLFDEVLNKLGEPPLFENQNFAVCSAFEVFPNYLVMENIHKVKNSLPITI